MARTETSRRDGLEGPSEQELTRRFAGKTNDELREIGLSSDYTPLAQSVARRLFESRASEPLPQARPEATTRPPDPPRGRKRIPVMLVVAAVLLGGSHLARVVYEREQTRRRQENLAELSRRFNQPDEADIAAGQAALRLLCEQDPACLPGSWMALGVDGEGRAMLSPCPAAQRDGCLSYDELMGR